MIEPAYTGAARAGKNVSSGSRRRAVAGLDRRGLLHGDLVGGTRRDLGPSLALLDGLTHVMNELRLGEITLPASTVIQVDKMCTPTLRKRAPFLRGRIECMDRRTCRHGKAVACRRRDV
jgi:hypothetical protein